MDKERIERVCQTAFKDKLLESSSGRSYIIPDWRFRSGLGSRKVFFRKFGLVLGIALGIVAVALLVNFIVTILIWNPLEVGCKKLFIQCEYGTAETRCIWSVINRRDGKNVGWIMFVRTLFVSLWSLLFIIPGIIKQYEYMMIPFLLAENPQMNRKEAFEKSRQMMKGNKWAAFVLDLSFIGWSLLGIITFGLVNIFFAGPYQYLTQSQLYFRLKEQQKEESYGY